MRSTLAISCVLFDLIALCILMKLYIEVDLHAQVLPQIRAAMLGVVLSPFVAQVGALLGTAIGALMATASGRGTRTIRRTAWTGLIAGSGLGLIAMICYLAATTSPSRTGSIAASIVKQPPSSTFLALPRAVVAPPNWVGSGVPFDVAAYFAAPPSKENAAPLYIDALMEFYPGMASCFSTDEGRRRGELASERQSDTAAFLKSPETTNPAKLDEHLQQFEVGFLKLSQAQRFRCVFQPGIGFRAALPHCQAVREVAKVARLRSVRLLQVGQVDRAILDVDCLLHLSRDLRLRGDVITQLVSVALDYVVCANLIPPILNHHGLQSAQCTRLFSVLDQHRKEAPDLFLEGYRSEYFFVGQLIYDVLLQLSSAERSGTAQMRRKLKLILERSERFGGSSDEIEARLEKVADRLARSTFDAFLAESMHEHNTYFGDLLALAKLPPMERKRQVAMLRSPQFAGRPLIELFPPADNEAFLNALTRHAAQLVATECLIALRLWEFSGKATPVSLTDLVRAAGMSEIPTDPYREDGGMLQLVSIKGNPVVYSIGPDGVDDFGLIDCEFTKKPRGDLLFPLRIDAPIVPPRGSDRNK